MIESSKRSRPWRADVRSSVEASAPVNWELDGAMAVRLVFRFRRPKNHYNSKGELRPSAPQYCTSRIGDIDKMERLVLDAICSIAYHDDAQVVKMDSEKRYCRDLENEGVFIQVSALE